MGNGCQDLTALNSLLVRWAYLSYKKKKHLESRHRQLRKHSTSLSENGGILSLSGRASETHPRPCKQCSACQENKTCTATATFFIANHKLATSPPPRERVRPRLICTYATHNHTTALSGCDVCQGCFISSFMWLTCSFLFLLPHICFLFSSLSCNFIGIAVYVWGGVLNKIKMFKKICYVSYTWILSNVLFFTHTHTHTRLVCYPCGDSP